MVTDELDVAFFDYAFPPERIAHAPAEPRDSSRLLYVPAHGARQHLHFGDVVRIIKAGDLLVLNETRVIKARLQAERVHTGGHIELLLLGPDPNEADTFRVMAKPARRMKSGDTLRIGQHYLQVLDTARVRFSAGVDIRELCENYGEVPLPPYIEARPELDVDRAYQPVFARVEGSIAAPTASLHFTNDLLNRISEKGAELAKLVLEVGLGTFAPVRATNFRDHEIHEEQFSVPQTVADAISRTRARGGRVIAVGTTVVRALETAADGRGNVTPQSGWTRVYITPGFDFTVVDALITNFHVPRSTLLAMVSAFGGRERILAAYHDAIGREYRLFSFGDAMFIERFRGS